MAQQPEGRITAAEVADFLEKGLLENLVILFRSDPSLYPLLAPLLEDERIVIRLGTSALVEGLAEEDPEHTAEAVQALLPLLESSNHIVRGDAAYLVGLIGRQEALPALRKLSDDENADVREAVIEALERIESITAPPRETKSP